MPCNCDYMEPNSKEQDSKETAQNLVYVYKQLGIKAGNQSEINKAAKDYYGMPEKLNDHVVQLCALLSNLTDKQLDEIVYNGRSKKARQVAEWWERHQEADKERIKFEESVKEKDKLIKSAKSKLTKAERKALGIDD